MLKLYVDHKEVPITRIDFPSGEFKIVIPAVTMGNCSIYCNQEFDILPLAFLVQALRVYRPDIYIQLGLFYTPFARQDRQILRGDSGDEVVESFSLKVYTDLINSLKFDEVVILDPHSDVAPALINNCYVKDSVDFVTSVVEQLKDSVENLVLIAPDAGASKKVAAYAADLNLDYFVCSKKRNLKNGKLEFKPFLEDLTGKHCLVVDDICSYGGTFVGVAKMLKQAGAEKLYLAVTFDEGVADERVLKEAGYEKMFKTSYLSDRTSNFFIIP